LITRADINGDLHAHTTASDGTASIEEMATAAKALGYKFLAITDHSKALAMTNGLSVERLMAHIENVHRISDTLKGITLLAGSEVDILADPRLDLSDTTARHAIEAGCMLSINADAHGIDEFEGIIWGIGVARRAWATPKHVINCMKLDDLRGFLKRKRDR